MKIPAIASIGAGFVLVAGIAGAEPKQLAIEDFAKTPSVTSMSMSLEGDMLVGLVADPSKDGEEPAAAYWDLTGEIDTSKPLLPTAITPSGPRTNFFGATALKNKKSLWFTVQGYTGALLGCGEGNTTGSTKKYLQKVYMGNEKITKIDDLPDGRAEIGASDMMLRCFELEGDTSIASFLPLHPTDIILQRVTSNEGPKLFRHNLETGKEKFLRKGSSTQNFYLDGRTGLPFASQALDFRDGAWHQDWSLANAEGKLTSEPALTVTLESRYEMEVFGQKSDTEFYVGTDKFSDKVAIYVYDTATDSFSSDPVFAHPEFSASDMVFSQREQDFNAVLGFVYGGPVATTYWVDPELRSIQSGLDSAFEGHNVTLNNYTADRNRVLFTVSSAQRPPEYYLLLDKSKLAVIGGERPWIDQEALGESEFLYYTARDGMSIPAFVTYPPGFRKDQKARGAIIHPHGGPWARDSGGFDSAGWRQYFASRGYIVLRPQYRGSQGFGRELWLAGDKEWGQKMQDDKDDAAAWLVEQGYVDADKIAIHGYSYGGFAAIAASVRPNSPYQCAIAGAGVANLTRLGNLWGDNRIQRVFQGQTVTGMDPMDNTEKVNIPIQLYHGDYDVRVPLWHSRDFYNKIKKSEPESELIVMKKMGHQGIKWLPEHKAEMLQEMERFLETTCGM